MSKLMLVLGIILAAIGLALGVMVFSSPAQLQVWGITPETAAILLTGGILAMGLGGVMAALQTGVSVATATAEDIEVAAAAPYSHTEVFPSTPSEPAPALAPEPVAEVEVPEPEPKRGFKFGFGRKAAEAAAAGAVVGTAVEAVALPTNKSVAETLEALEQAKAELKASVGLDPTPTLAPLPAPAPAPVAPVQVVEEVAVEEEIEEAVAEGEGDLYVVEEQVVRGHAARVLSDGTVEAETSEGWMRFENLEHLNEYLDATETA